MRLAYSVDDWTRRSVRGEQGRRAASQKQILFEDDNKKGKGKKQARATAERKGREG